jgi:hypothetical protein
LNVACFLIGGITKAFPEITGEPYIDASQAAHLSLVRQLVLVFAADKDQLRNVGRRASEREVPVAI